MKTLTAILTLAAALTIAAPAMADWNIGEPYKMHFPQLPDLDNGMNVLATHPKVLADDFLCTETGPITDIHIWGSWLEDRFPQGATGAPDPGNVQFHLSIHSDIPADQNPFGLGYSMPAPDPLWTADLAPSAWRPWATSGELFFDPNQGIPIGTDTQVIQYNFFLDPANAFQQKRGTIYWLDVTAFPGSADALFGWKTSMDHWQDDAVFWDDIPGTSVPPKELFGPAGNSLDLAFVITPEPATLALLGVGTLAALLKRRRR